MNARRAITLTAPFLVLVATLFVNRVSVPATAPDETELILGHLEHEAEIIRHAEWAGEKKWDFHINGMEPNSAGIRVLRPFPDPHTPANRLGDMPNSGGYWFWPLRTKYELDEYRPDGMLDDTAAVSFNRVIKNAWMDVAVLPDQNPGEYRLAATFDAQGITNVTRVVGIRESNSSFMDWFNVHHPDGGTATEMRVILVSGDRAYLPISATAIAEAVAPYSVDLANGLPFEEAERISGYLQR